MELIRLQQKDVRDIIRRVIQRNKYFVHSGILVGRSKTTGSHLDIR